MKTRILFLMIFVVAVLAAVSPAVQAVDVVLDPMTLGAIVDMPPGVRDGIPGRWVDLREPAEGSGYLKDSAFSHDGGGSMRIDYSGQVYGSQWDREIAGYFAPLFPPVMPDLSNGYDPLVPDSTLGFSFWMWTAGTVGGVVAPERLRELQIYSPGARMLYEVTAYNYADPVGGWSHVIAPLTGFVPGGGIFDWSAINEVKFFLSSWKGDGPLWIADPLTGSSVYIDDLRIVPEPATMSLLGLGTLALLKRRKA